MGFTTQCFIHKNTANIRNRLKELGYYCNPYLGWHNLFTCVFGVNSVYSLDDYETNLHCQTRYRIRYHPTGRRAG